MAKLSLSLLLFFFFIFCINIGTVEPLSRAAHSQARAFVEASCRTTRYPALCVKWLTCHASSNTPPTAQQLTRTALTVNLYRARHVRLYLVKVAKELKATKAKEYLFTALTEFPGQRMSKMKATIKSKVLNVAQLTSNALALFHRYAAAAIEKHP
ncbi:hypothetical protein GOBAR_AA07854 [Gossypium barbadense]|uniref:Pectinesterase inhibitor domain-containing protein n=1 Tax=Gossypium barbadense TaxID=3634 RepID=A0A2P5YB85_GOSBA|nr:hypothetical protein GOBAR_AA07854 [Gossypium barbadense]